MIVKPALESYCQPRYHLCGGFSGSWLRLDLAPLRRRTRENGRDSFFRSLILSLSEASCPNSRGNSCDRCVFLMFPYGVSSMPVKVSVRMVSSILSGQRQSTGLDSSVFYFSSDQQVRQWHRNECTPYCAVAGNGVQEKRRLHGQHRWPTERSDDREIDCIIRDQACPTHDLPVEFVGLQLCGIQ